MAMKQTATQKHGRVDVMASTDHCIKCWKPLTWMDLMWWPCTVCNKCIQREGKDNE